MSFRIHDFSPIKFEDRPQIEAIVNQYSGPLSCEFAFANLYNWQQDYHTKFLIEDGRLWVTFEDGESVLFPLGPEPSPQGLLDMALNISAAGAPAGIGHVPQSYVDRHPELNQFFLSEASEDHADYIYLAESLYVLSGKKLRKKRNHISQFKRNNPDYTCRRLQEHEVHLCYELARRLYDADKNEFIIQERHALCSAVRNFQELQLEALGVFIDGTLIAFSMFSRETPDMYVIHFERAEHGVKGASQVINQYTAEVLHESCTYINREQDLGIPGLRKSKRSYAPDVLLVNHFLEVRPEFVRE